MSRNHRSSPAYRADVYRSYEPRPWVADIDASVGESCYKTISTYDFPTHREAIDWACSELRRLDDRNCCICLVDPKYWYQYYGLTEPGSAFKWDPSCPVHPGLPADDIKVGGSE